MVGGSEIETSGAREVSAVILSSNATDEGATDRECQSLRRSSRLPTYLLHLFCCNADRFRIGPLLRLLCSHLSLTLFPPPPRRNERFILSPRGPSENEGDVQSIEEQPKGIHLAPTRPSPSCYLWQERIRPVSGCRGDGIKCRGLFQETHIPSLPLSLVSVDRVGRRWCSACEE